MLKNFIWQRENEPQNALSYVFLLQNFVYGIVFGFFSFSDVVQRSPFNKDFFDPALWGFALLILVGLTVFGIATRNRFIGEKVGFLGVALWGYGVALYIVAGSWFAAAVIYFPQVLFWTFWYIGVKRYYHRETVALTNPG